MNLNLLDNEDLNLSREDNNKEKKLKEINGLSELIVEGICSCIIAKKE